MIARIPPRLRRRTVLGPALFALLTLVTVLIIGVPYQRDVMAVWLLVGLLCCSLSDVRGYVRGVVVDWLPFIAILIAYDSLRGTAGRLGVVHYLPQLQVDRWLFGDAPTATLQHWLWHGHITWYDVVFWATYLTHFFATPLVAAVLWKLDRARFRRFALLVGALSFAALVTYAFYPAAPPWMASQAGLMSPVTRIIPLVWQSIGLHSAGSLVESGYQYANDVAAVPSLHAGFSMLIAVTLWPRRHRWLRPFVAAYPVLMAFSLVFGAEHYVSDVLLGWGYTAAVVLAVRCASRWWEARQARRTPARGSVPAPVTGRALPELSG